MPKVYPSDDKGKTATQMQPGDVCAGSGFVVVRAWPYRLMCAPKGKVCIEGHYPGKPDYHYHWNASTRIRVK